MSKGSVESFQNIIEHQDQTQVSMKASRGGLKCLCYKFVWLKGFKGKKLLSSKGLFGYMALFEAPPFIIPLPKVVEGINFEDEYKEPEGQIHDYIRNF